ncbi:hypothetical protein BaRGS_00010466 [Batillaria attramentaria]|uniref:Uncharacterized protein n=1 Tax=Batillaria attramentaria TaxID=370345 RepID=A0ABD0LFD7_9CAEN
MTSRSERGGDRHTIRRCGVLVEFGDCLMVAIHHADFLIVQLLACCEEAKSHLEEVLVDAALEIRSRWTTLGQTLSRVRHCREDIGL